MGWRLVPDVVEACLHGQRSQHAQRISIDDGVLATRLREDGGGRQPNVRSSACMVQRSIGIIAKGVCIVPVHDDDRRILHRCAALEQGSQGVKPATHPKRQQVVRNVVVRGRELDGSVRDRHQVVCFSAHQRVSRGLCFRQVERPRAVQLERRVPGSAALGAHAVDSVRPPQAVLARVAQPGAVAVSNRRALRMRIAF